jgi:hypothetical protein
MRSPSIVRAWSRCATTTRGSRALDAAYATATTATGTAEAQ